MVTLAARTSDPAGMREVLARLQDPLARALAGDQGATPTFQSVTIAGADAFTLDIADGFAPTYAVTGDKVVVSTSPAGLEARTGAHAPAARPRAASVRRSPESRPGSSR